MHPQDTIPSPRAPFHRALAPLLRRLALGAVSGAGLLAAALAQTHPSKAVTLVVPCAAGRTVDKVARQIQEPLIIDNRGGAGGTIGMASVVRSSPDGYTLAMVFDSYATEQHIYPKLPAVTLREAG
ncbi:tripartite tricarboxylate transporter substrate-binding protein [Rhodoferax koreense]